MQCTCEGSKTLSHRPLVDGVKVRKEQLWCGLIPESGHVVIRYCQEAFHYWVSGNEDLNMHFT